MPADNKADQTVTVPVRRNLSDAALRRQIGEALRYRVGGSYPRLRAWRRAYFHAWTLSVAVVALLVTMVAAFASLSGWTFLPACVFLIALGADLRLRQYDAGYDTFRGLAAIRVDPDALTLCRGVTDTSIPIKHIHEMVRTPDGAMFRFGDDQEFFLALALFDEVQGYQRLTAALEAAMLQREMSREAPVEAKAPDVQRWAYTEQAFDDGFVTGHGRLRLDGVPPSIFRISYMDKMRRALWPLIWAVSVTVMVMAWISVGQLNFDPETPLFSLAVFTLIILTGATFLFWRSANRYAELRAMFTLFYLETGEAIVDPRGLVMVGGGSEHWYYWAAVNRMYATETDLLLQFADGRLRIISHEGFPSKEDFAAFTAAAHAAWRANFAAAGVDVATMHEPRVVRPV